MRQTFFCRTVIACAIAGIDQRAFQSAIEAGAYPHAPGCQRGGNRVFSQDDVAALVVFGWMRGQGFGAKLAGRVSELALQQISPPIYNFGGSTLGLMSIDMQGTPSLTPAGKPPGVRCRLVIDAADALASAVAGARAQGVPVKIGRGP